MCRMDILLKQKERHHQQPPTPSHLALNFEICCSERLCTDDLRPSFCCVLSKCNLDVLSPDHSFNHLVFVLREKIQPSRHQSV